MIKIIALMLILIMSVTICSACSQAESGAETPASVTESAAETDASEAESAAETDASVADSAAETNAAETESPAETPAPVTEYLTETYTIQKVNGEVDWAAVPILPIDKVLWTADTGIRAQGQLCYDEENLYVHLRAVEKDIRAENTEPMSPVYEDSCMEFFFMIKGADNYFNFEINPNGCMNEQFGPSKTDRFNLVRQDAAEYFAIHTDRTDDGWEAFYMIPLEYIRLFYPDYRFEGELAGNMYKCGNLTVNRHYLSWSPIELETPNFHCPEYFGTLRFEE